MPPELDPALDPRLGRWLEALLGTPGLTSIREPEQARREHVADSLQATRSSLASRALSPTSAREEEPRGFPWRQLSPSAR